MIGRAKRPRTASAHAAPTVASGHHSGMTHSSRARGMSDDNMGDDYLLHMDPSLMTERQQLAFLLRTTAQEQSGADSMASESSDNDDHRPAHHQAARSPSTKRAKQARIPHSQQQRDANKETGETKVHRGRGRPRKHPIKTEPLTTEATKRVATTKTTPSATARSSKKTLHVKTSSPRTMSPSDDGDGQGKQASIEKTSPSSTSDLAHMDAMGDDASASDFWRLDCALCCQATRPYETSADALFLCSACDKKYPTQRALGRV